ncbi:FAD-dependent oxidoreductase [Phytoactinopolyspora sp. XMNu-373]|uniref:FAD-dependent oxidoreductase n=2 Tax=Phytoactinopolyspora mesophila TaxID=2650750 RepID=A0A7K3M189_9ACTN|nr:FAD-dependent oxidoreductase [Phytoactinopolyspora mesophila]
MGGRVEIAPGTPQGLSRRRFLTRVGMAGGAATLYGSMAALGLTAGPAAADEFRPPRQNELPTNARGRTSVVILGAGIAGLTAAYELQKAGYDCHILETRDRPGGRIRTIRGGDTLTDTDGVTQTAEFDDGQYFNAGPARIPNHHVTLDYCRELGVSIEALVNANAESLYYHENTGSTDYGPLANTPITHRQAKADYYGYVSELLATAVDQGALDDVLSTDDAERLISFANSFGDLRGGKYVGSGRRGYTEAPGAGHTSGVFDEPPPMSAVLHSQMGNRFSFEFGFNQAMMMWQPVGGMDRIPFAMADAVGKKNITYNATVTEIRNTSSGVVVAYTSGRPGRTRTIQADHCIATIPPMVLRDISSNLSNETKTALAVPTGANTGKIGLQYKRRFWEEDEKIFGGITATNMDVAGIWYPSSGFLGQKGVIVGYYSGAYTDLSIAEREERAVAQGVKIHGDAYRDELETSFSIAWTKVPEALGGWANWPNPRGDAYEHLLKPDGHIYFAGDHLSHNIGWQAGAIDSARMAVMNLHERLVATAA